MKRVYGMLALVLVGAALIFALWLDRASSSNAPRIEPPKSASVLPPRAPVVIPPRVQLPGGPYEAEDPRWAERAERKKREPDYEWQMQIAFFGKVVDYDTGEPIPGVEFLFSWKDLSPEGTSTATAYSDEQGLLQLSGVMGKSLLLREMQKPGYLRANVEERFFFDYAAFWDDNYYQPDPTKPIIFRMKKLSDSGVPLVHRAGEIALGIGQAGIVNLDSQASVQVELAKSGPHGEQNWAASINVSGGGIRVSTDEFPFTAPNGGYQSFLTLDTQTPKPGNWIGIYQGGQFYIRTADGRFGRLDLKAVPGKAFMRYELWLNPIPGSRILDCNPIQRPASP